MATLKDVLARLDVRGETNGEYRCICPAHKDKNPSLHVTEKDGKILMDCKGHCSIDDILSAIGFTKADLFTEPSKGLYEKPKYIAYLESKTKATFVEEYKYATEEDKYLFSKFRLIEKASGEKTMRYGVLDNDEVKLGLPVKGTDASGKVLRYSRKELPLHCYFGKCGAKGFKRAIQEGKTIFYVEGEKDVNTLQDKGYVAVTFGASTDWEQRNKDIFVGAKNVIILADNDEAGIQLANDVQKDIKGVVGAVKIIIPTPDCEKGDISDFFALGKSVKDFEQLIKKKDNILDKINFFTATELQQMELPPIRYVCNPIIAEGVGIISAKPKLGKSIWALQLCLSVSNGTDFLGFKTEKGKALYFDLETNRNVQQSRLKMTQHGTIANSNLIYVADADFGDGKINIPQIGNGFEDVLIAFLEKWNDIKLVVIDVFARVQGRKSKTESDYDFMYRNITPLKAIANQYHVAILLVMHDRKMVDTTDPFANIIGSTGTIGAVDEIIVLHKQKRTDANVSISITGRTIAEQELVAKLDKDAMRWSLIGGYEEVQAENERIAYNSNPVVRTIKKLLEQSNGNWKGKASEIRRSGDYFGYYISYTDAVLGKRIDGLCEDLRMYDGIIVDKRRSSKSNESYTYEIRYLFE